MKFRKDFVTNSSSSSYVCEICGASESGWDLSLREAGMVECENGHVICQDEMLEVSREQLLEYLEKEFDCDVFEEYKDSSDDILIDMLLHEDTYSDFIYNVPECFCPICQFIEYSQNDLARYLAKKYKVSRDEVFEKVKQLNKRRKKLYDSEYVTEVCSRFNLNPTEIIAGLKSEFGTYKRFRAFIGG